MPFGSTATVLSLSWSSLWGRVYTLGSSLARTSVMLPSLRQLTPRGLKRFEFLFEFLLGMVLRGTLLHLYRTLLFVNRMLSHLLNLCLLVQSQTGWQFKCETPRRLLYLASPFEMNLLWVTDTSFDTSLTAAECSYANCGSHRIKSIVHSYPRKRQNVVSPKWRHIVQ